MTKLPVYSTPSPLKLLREGLGLSLRELGTEAKIDFRRLSIIERGLSNDEVKRLAKLVTKKWRGPRRAISTNTFSVRRLSANTSTTHHRSRGTWTSPSSACVSGSD